MPPVARAGDMTNHPGVLQVTGAVTRVLIGGMPAAVVGTMHVCSIPSSPPHPPAPVIPPGSTSVLIQGRPAARIGDATGCGAQIITGASTVLIGG